MCRRWLRRLLTLGVVLLVPATAWGGHRQEPTWELGNRASAAARRVARNALAQFDRSAPGWKVRMEALVGLAKAGRVVDKLAVIVNANRQLESNHRARVSQP